jgi:hypothetical protein
MEVASNFSIPTDKFKFPGSRLGAPTKKIIRLYIRTYPALEFHQFGLRFGVACRLCEKYWRDLIFCGLSRDRAGLWFWTSLAVSIRTIDRGYVSLGPSIIQRFDVQHITHLKI